MIVEVVGVMGGVLFLIAFFKVSTGTWKGNSLKYEAYNLLGALFLGWYAIEKHAYTNIILNIIWGFVAIQAIYHLPKRHRTRKKLKQKTRKA